jgi:hypothetical protein
MSNTRLRNRCYWTHQVFAIRYFICRNLLKGEIFQGWLATTRCFFVNNRMAWLCIFYCFITRFFSLALSLPHHEVNDLISTFKDKEKNKQSI